MELKEMIAPYWSPEHNGVVIPLLNKVLDLKNLSDQPRNRWENKELAKQAGKELMTNEDFHILYWQRNHHPIMLRAPIWSDHFFEFHCICV